ncbi:efflux protein [Shinella sp. DD12]|uniref:efflux protein n=1 Tax=Shinella sp. DD12 TaxID=1410620 RepID=UPI0003C53B9E|nr:efflux protein [Shinella sp. DD12]EYR83780.1 putative efflux protein [Shinella sp. DD12]
MQDMREWLESRQVSIYFITVVIAALVACVVPAATLLEPGINPALALMLFVTFLQVPLTELGKALTQIRFFAALLLTNFVVLPALVGLSVGYLGLDPLLTLGVLLVLLTPCIDYVVTFAHLGRADARLLLAATPALLIVQMLLLPVYLGLFLGEAGAGLVQLGPFVHAFVWLIALPLVLAGLVQAWAARQAAGAWTATRLGLLPVPATALVLFVVIASVVPQLGTAIGSVRQVIPIYVVFAILAPLVGWGMARLFGLEPAAGRAIAFSAGTRNSLVVLPLALAVPEAVPILPAIIVTQTLVELVGELIYVRMIPRLRA